jgi:hypothetical protein
MMFEGSFLFLVAAGRSQFLGGFGTGGVLALPHHFLLVHFLRVIDVDVWALFLRDAALLFLVIVQDHAQVLEHGGGDLVAEVLDGGWHLVEVQLQDVVLSEAWVVIAAGNRESSLAA